MKISVVILLLMCISCVSSTVPRNLRGSWENSERGFTFTKDSVYVQEKEPVSIGCEVQKKRHAKVSQLSLIVVNKGTDYDLSISAPYAIYEVHRDSLFMQRVDCTGLRIKDFPFFPWPDEFGQDSIWVLKRP